MASPQPEAMSSTSWPPSPPRSPTRSVTWTDPDSVDPITTPEATTTTMIVPPELAPKAPQQQQQQQQGQAVQFPLSPQISPLLAATTVPPGVDQQQIQHQILLQLQEQTAQIQHQISQQQQLLQTNIPTIITPPQPAALAPPPNRQSISSTTSSSSSSHSAASSSLSAPSTSPSSTSSGAVSPGGHRMSLQSIAKMPPIHEDADSIFTDVGPASRRRSTRSGGFYQYGEDYITTYDDLGGLPSPQPPQRPGSVVSVRSARSVSPGSISDGSVAGAGGSGYFLNPNTTPNPRRASSRLSVGSVSASGISKASRQASTSTTVIGSLSEDEKDRRMSLNYASIPEATTSAAASSSFSAMTDRGASSDLGERGLKEGSVDDGDVVKSRGCFRRWLRTIVLLIVILIVAGFAVGLAFGLKNR